MKRILKPEDERVVTPGPKAVEDLVSYTPPTSQKQMAFENISTTNQQGMAESYDRINLQLHTVPNQPELAMIRGNAHRFLPSSALTFAMLREAVRQYSDKGVLLRRSYQDISYIQNTLIDWERGLVIHYPQGDMFREERDGMNVGITPIVQSFPTLWMPLRADTHNLEDVACKDFVSAIVGTQQPLNDPEIMLTEYESVSIRLPTMGIHPPQSIVAIGPTLDCPGLLIQADLGLKDAHYMRWVTK